MNNTHLLMFEEKKATDRDKEKRDREMKVKIMHRRNTELRVRQS